MREAEKEDCVQKKYKVAYLQMLMCLYPILGEAGLGIDGSVLVTTENEQAQRQLWNCINLFQKELLPLSATPKQVEHYCQEAQFGVLCFRYKYGRYTMQNFDAVQAISHSIKRELEAQRLILIFFICGVPDNISSAGRLYISQSELNAMDKGVNVKDFIFFLEMNENMIKNIISACETHEGSAFKVLVITRMIYEKFIIERLAVEDIPSFLEDMAYFQAELEREWESEGEPIVYVRALYQGLLENINNLPMICDRKYLFAQDIKNIGQIIFYDESAYYFSDHLLQNIIKSVLPECRYTFFKSQLGEAGVLDCTGKVRSYYTRSREIVTEYGVILRQRRVKILREKFDRMGEFTLLEWLQMKGEENHGGKAWKISGNQLPGQYFGRGR